MKEVCVPQTTLSSGYASCQNYLLLLTLITVDYLTYRSREFVPVFLVDQRNHSTRVLAKNIHPNQHYWFNVRNPGKCSYLRCTTVVMRLLREPAHISLEIPRSYATSKTSEVPV